MYLSRHVHYTLGQGICVNLLHVIGDGCGVTDPGVLSWLIAGYSLTAGTFILFTGRVGDLVEWNRTVRDRLRPVRNIVARLWLGCVHTLRLIRLCEGDAGRWTCNYST